MKIFKDFEKYIPTDEVKLELMNERNIEFIKSSCGIDWYDLRQTLTEGKFKVLLQKGTNIVVAETFSVDGVWPLGFDLVELDDTPHESVLGLQFVEKTGKFIPYVHPDEVLVELAMSRLSALRRVAMEELDILKMTAEIDKLSADEKKRMEAIKKYLVDLMRVPTQKGYPQNIIWPTV